MAVVRPLEYKFPKKFSQLISLHKSGSTWVFSYIHKQFRKMGITMPPNNLYSEFFYIDRRLDEKNYTSELDFSHKVKNEFIKRSLEERFALLELLRKFGLELAQKAHVPEIIDIWPRFKEFYKDYDILVLKRRHIFSHYLHMLFFYCVQQAVGPHFLKGKEEEGYTHIVPSKIHHGRSEDILKSTILEYNVQFKHHDKYLKKFTRNIRFLNDVVIEELDKPEVIFTEDITTQWLRDRFNEGVDLKKTVEPFKTLDFATYFKPEELKIVHDKLYERFDNEFKYMGYLFQ